MLEIDGLTVRFGGLMAVNAVSFTVEAGEICAIVGPNGAGKTTIFNAITGFATVQSGSILFEGKPLLGLPPHRIAARGISRTFQHNGLIPDLTVLENVMLGQATGMSAGLPAVIFGTSRAWQEEAKALAASRSMLRTLDLERLAGMRTDLLPFGQQRLVEISRALASGAKLLLLDEPAVGLFETERQSLCTVLKQLASKGVGILLIEHVLDVVKAVSDRIVFMNHGEKLVECSPSELQSNERVRDIYLGHA
jgi:ABC-type branched-subunit amino acid transport system ATPase component